MVKNPFKAYKNVICIEQKSFPISSVVGLIIVGIFVALEFTGVINFIDYQP